MTAAIVALLIAHEIFAAGSQVAFKMGADLHEGSSTEDLNGYLRFLGTVFRSPAIWCGIVLTIITWFLWFVILAKIDLTVAVPIDSLQNVLILVAAYLFLKEPIGWTRVAGILAIVAGIALVAIS